VDVLGGGGDEIFSTMTEMGDAVRKVASGSSNETDYIRNKIEWTRATANIVNCET
jgi:hypothetical protein